MQNRTPAETIEEHLDALFALEDVAGVAEGERDSEPCIKVYLVQENSRTVLALPAELDGYPLVFEVTGNFGTGT